MNERRGRVVVVTMALAATLLLFWDYLAARRVFVSFDLLVFHYPLADYAFMALKIGRFPLWDPTIYSGLPFAANMQAQLFYPPLWMLYALNLHRAHLPFWSFECYALLHVTLAMVLSFAWLRKGLRLETPACAVGAGVYACSGYMMTQLQHLGLVTGFAWWPLAFLGVEEGVFWKVASASALVVLAGYAPLWVVFAVCVLAYAAARRRLAMTAGALALSLAISAVQLLPMVEASRLAVQQSRYGNGYRDPMFYVTLLAPNFWDFDIKVPVGTHPAMDYWYWGGAGLLGVLCAAFTKKRKVLYPALAMLGAAAFFLMDPTGKLAPWLGKPSLLSGMIRSWYFMAGIAAAGAGLAAIGVDRLLGVRALNGAWLAGIAVALRAAMLWRTAPAAGWSSAWDTAWGVGLAAGCLLLVRQRRVAALLLCASALIEYKALGTGKRFNASADDFPAAAIRGLNERVAAEMRAHPEYRVLGDYGPHPTPLRHTGLATPQGFDPILPVNYAKLVEHCCKFVDDRAFTVDPLEAGALERFGVRYVLTTEEGPSYAGMMAAKDRFRLMEPNDSYFKVFEYVQANPAYLWDGGGIALKQWRPERRVFAVEGAAAGTLQLTEQFYPGWRALVDGVETPVKLCGEAFQCVGVAAGRHTVEFRYGPAWLWVGATISILGVAALMLSRRLATVIG